MNDPRLLAIYLSDHRAGSAGGVELAGRAAAANSDNRWGEPLAEIQREIEGEIEALETIMSTLDVKPNPLKNAAAWSAEKVGRLKPNGRLHSYSPLSRVVELEGLKLGVTGKLSLWLALQQLYGESVGGVSLTELQALAESQLERLERMRLEAVAEAFASEIPAAGS